MPLTINGKIWMNLQEAVAWLLANNALPFQSTANFVADTEIAKTTIINPSPAEIKIGSLVLFADGKVGTVSGITASGFMVGPDATDLSDGVPHITDIQIDASNHLIFTMSEGDPIDAGLVKEVSSMSIDASQHLIVNYNDGTSSDLGAIFQGNVNISGTLTVGDAQIFEKISDANGRKRFVEGDGTIITTITGFNITYNKWSLSGSHLMMVVAGTIEAGTTIDAGNPDLVRFGIPNWVLDKIYPMVNPFVDYKSVILTLTGYSEADNMKAILVKEMGQLKVRLLSKTLSNTSLASFRIQFDLLIDNA